MYRSRYRRGAALVTCMIFMVVLLALGAGFATMSGANVQLAINQRKTARASAAAESGLEVMRYWLSHVKMAAATPTSAYFMTIVAQVQTALADETVTNVVLSNSGTVPAVSVNAATGQNFSAELSMAGDTTLVVAVTGTCGEAARTVSVGFTIAPYQHPIFNFGLATKGPIHFPNNPTTSTVTSNWEADIYTDSTSLQAVYVGGNANFDGDISLGGAGADVDFARDVQIAGETGETAIENHVHRDAEPVEFPTPDTDRFVPYATGPVIDANMLSSTGMTLTNATIPAGMNPTFGGTVNIRGILLIEQPNVVTFGKNVTREGIIVSTAPSTFTGGNQINVQGNFASQAFPSGSEFDAIRTEEGTAILTPGFDVSFTGNYSAIEGVVAADGLYFSGNASATIHGSLLSYSANPTVVEGNVSLTFDRAGSIKIPAGFDTLRVLEYDAQSYAMN